VRRHQRQNDCNHDVWTAGDRLERPAHRDKLDRYARSLKHLVNALAELEALGVAFISLRDNLDLSTPAGRLMFQIIGAMSEFERSLIQERVRSGLRNAKSKGIKLGRPRKQHERDADARVIREMRESGAPFAEIAQLVGRPVPTVFRIAKALGCEPLPVLSLEV